MKPSKETPVICWWSGGITSAVACKIALDTYGTENCRVIMIDTQNEDEDTERFRLDWEKWFGIEVQKRSAIKSSPSPRYGRQFESIQDLWLEFESLNVASGAICSSYLKREVRQAYQRRHKYSAQVFGFDISEHRRAENMRKNYPASMPIFPLLEFGLSKEDCAKIVGNADIKIPRTYKYGFRNNNCFQTGCVQGGIGYWQKIQRDFPEKFLAMAEMEHKLTDLKGKPVTCLKDQSNEAKKHGMLQVFLIAHPNYPNNEDLSMMKGRDVEPLPECNGFCGTEDSGKTKF